MEYEGSEYEAFSSTSTQELEPCNYCGRSFNPDSLARHERICQKSSHKKRKVFDMTKQRAEGTDIKVPKNRPKPGQPAPKEPTKKSNWRAKHEEFISAIRAARGVQKAINEGGPLPPPPPPTVNPDYVQCPHCGRRFNETAAQRHISFCKEQKARLPNKKTVDATAKQRAAARTQYKPPKLKSKSGVTSPTGSAGGGFGRTTSGSTTNGSARAPGAGGSSRIPGGRTGAARPTATRTVNGTPPRGGGFSQTNGSAGRYQASRYGDDCEDGSPTPQSGRVLRTGRTQETYSEARQLSAKQRAGMPKSPRYTNYTPSPPASGRNRPPSGKNSHNAVGLESDVDQYFTPKRIGSAAKFCHECGTKYPVSNAKFCCECGIRRVFIN